MSSSSYSYGQSGKGAYASRPSTSTSCMFCLPNSLPIVTDTLRSAYSGVSSSSTYAHSSSSSRRYGSKPPIIHNGGGASYDDNTSSSAPNGSYHS